MPQHGDKVKLRTGRDEVNTDIIAFPTVRRKREMEKRERGDKKRKKKERDETRRVGLKKL